MYILFLIILIIAIVLERILISDREKNVLFICLAVLFTFVLALRYGQGTDYFGYMTNYNWYMFDEHDPILWRLLEFVFTKFKVPFEVFIGVISVVSMFGISRSIWMYSPYKCLSIALIYPTLYLTYFMSGIRQGLVVSIFLGYMIEMLLKKRVVHYIVLCIVLTFIHYCAFPLLLLLLLYKIDTKLIYIIISISIFVGIVLSVLPNEIFVNIENKYWAWYFTERYISILAVLERIVMFALLSFLKKKNLEESNSELLNLLYKIYCVGLIFLFLFLPFPQVAIRMGVANKAVEILLFPIYIKNKNYMRGVVTIFLVVYMTVMVFKNVNAYIEQGNYGEMSIIEYPYITIFDEEKAQKYRYGSYYRRLHYDEFYY